MSAPATPSLRAPVVDEAIASRFLGPFSPFLPFVPVSPFRLFFFLLFFFFFFFFLVFFILFFFFRASGSTARFYFRHGTSAPRPARGFAIRRKMVANCVEGNGTSA